MIKVEDVVEDWCDVVGRVYVCMRLKKEKRDEISECFTSLQLSESCGTIKCTKIAQTKPGVKQG